MFIGHYGAALAAKRIDGYPSLGTMFMASQFIDLLWPVFLLLGIEHVRIDPGNTAFTPLDFTYYPFSHSFTGVLIWAVLFGGVYFLLKRRTKSALVLGGLVLSHWLFDLIVHRADLPVFPWSDMKVGFGLWYSIAATLLFEGAIFAFGAYVYRIASRPANRKGTYSFGGLIVFLVAVYLMNVFGPPPESEAAIPYAGFALWLTVAWGYWIDRNRTTREV